MQAASLEGGAVPFWAVQYHPEYDLHEVASLGRIRKAELVAQGSFESAEAAEAWIDDLGCGALEGTERQDLREILEDRYSVSSTVVTSQFDPDDWHAFIGDETLADAICDRLVHNAHRLDLQGESMRKKIGMGGGSG